MKHLPLAIPLAAILTVGDSPPLTTKDWLVNAVIWVSGIAIWVWLRK
jgi:hypothetical protein